MHSHTHKKRRNKADKLKEQKWFDHVYAYRDINAENYGRLDFPMQWVQIKQRLQRSPAIYTYPERLVLMLDYCAQSPILKNFLLQLSLSRLLFCRYIGDTGLPCIYASEHMYIVSDLTGNIGTYFIKLSDLVVYLENRVNVLDEKIGGSCSTMRNTTYGYED